MSDEKKFCQSCNRYFKFDGKNPLARMVTHRKWHGYHCPVDGAWFASKKQHDEACSH